MMQNPLEKYRSEVSDIQALLAHRDWITLTDEERHAFLGSAEKIQSRIESLEMSSLTVGLLGGTGVGKSTVLNALTGASIATTSHRRPQTDRVLIYRFREAPIPERLLQSSMQYHEFLHDVEHVKSILLCDLPDFDSIRDTNRQEVLRFLEHLDVLVWVVSPEKYADGRFYSFLEEVPKSEQNFYFVFNKVDLFFGENEENEAGGGHASLGRVLGVFQQHLRGKGLTNPMVFAVSAAEAMAQENQSPWNQFFLFRTQIFKQRDLKEIVAIKAANLDKEIALLASALKKEVVLLRDYLNLIVQLRTELEGERPNWTENGRKAMDVWLEGEFKMEASRLLADISALMGPGYLLASVMREGRHWRSTPEPSCSLAQITSDPGTLCAIQHQLERIDSRFKRRILQANFRTIPFSESLSSVDAGERWRRVTDTMRIFLEERAVRFRSRSFRTFRSLQFLVYSSLWILFFLALGGVEGWTAFVQNPNRQDLTDVLLTILNHIFSPFGLAALGSFLLLQLFVGFRFYGKYKKMLQRRTQKFIASLKSEMFQLWEREFDLLLEDLNEHEKEIQARLDTLKNLRNTEH